MAFLVNIATADSNPRQEASSKIKEIILELDAHSDLEPFKDAL